ncbi:MAG: M1 family aminopeptidase [Chitinophagales bacterium]
MTGKLRSIMLGSMLTFCMHSGYAATATISDSIDIQHIEIHLQVTDFVGHTISGAATLHLEMRVDGISEIPLDLKGLTVDSVQDDLGNAYSYMYTDPLLTISTAAPADSGDVLEVTVYYHGVPDADPSWGGWYWSGVYSYQLGVGFDAIPHNFGRIWFPCFDNFIERSSFTYHITTNADKRAVCGGVEETPTDNGDGTITWHWHCAEEIPSYLASVAVAPYTMVEWTHHGIESDYPVRIAVLPADSADLVASFVHLDTALYIFETHYLPYAWDRVGYSVVPFSGGAMEHAMNIAYPLFAVNGATNWENLFVHELSHHWWGDLVTCSTPQEMWMNEGWASYSEHLFTEFLYGRDAYEEAIKANHTDVLHYAAARDGNNYFAISGVPESYTYGTTTYNKGADVIYTLRGYMGDDAFFSCIQSFLDTHRFQPVSAADLRDHLSACSGMDMTSFFDDWVYQPGWPAFEINKIGLNDASAGNICVQQKLDHADHFCTNVPLTITFLDGNFYPLDSFVMVMDGDHGTVSPIEADYPMFAVVDLQEKLNQATSSDLIRFDVADHYVLENGFLDANITALTDSAFIYARQYWVAADNFKTAHPGLHVSPDRYWQICTNLNGSTEGTFKFLYNSQSTLSGGYLDIDLITNTEDSLVLLYRGSFDADWIIYPYYTLNTWGTTSDGRGAFELSKLWSGEYTFAMYDHSIPDAPLDNWETECPDYASIQNTTYAAVHIFPNPTQDILTIQIEQQNIPAHYFMIDSLGKRVREGKLTETETHINVKKLPAGTYQLYVENAHSAPFASQKVLIIH